MDLYLSHIEQNPSDVQIIQKSLKIILAKVTHSRSAKRKGLKLTGKISVLQRWYISIFGRFLLIKTFVVQEPIFEKFEGL